MSIRNRTAPRSLWLIILTLTALLLTVAACGSPTEAPAQAEETAVIEATAAPAQEAAPTAEVTTPPVAETEAEAEAPISTEAQGSRTFVIDPAQSQARFYIDELLLGAPKRVEGITSQVSGQVTVNLGNYQAIEFAPITIAAESFVTDSDKRNGAINRFVLQTGTYPAITFTPTGVQNLPAEIAVGQPFSFQLLGDLTIRDITSPVTLEMTVTPVSESELHGSGSVTVQRATYDLSIPSVPSVANVSEDVLLEIDFVAVGQ